MKKMSPGHTEDWTRGLLHRKPLDDGVEMKAIKDGESVDDNNRNTSGQDEKQHSCALQGEWQVRFIEDGRWLVLNKKVLFFL